MINKIEKALVTYYLFNFFLGENTLNDTTVGNILPAQDIVNYELSEGEDEFYQPLLAQDGNGNDEQGKRLNFLLWLIQNSPT